MTDNAKPSWMPSEDRLREIAQNKCEDEEVRVEYLIRIIEAPISRAALDARTEMLKSLQGEFSWPGRTYGDIIADRLAALRAEREALP